MEFTFLGSSAGTPTRNRNVTALALSPGGAKPWYLVDCGEATQHQLMRSRYSVIQLKAIFITHIHGDHIFGLPGLLTSASMLGREAPLDVIAPPQVGRFIEAAIANSDSTLSFELNLINSEADDFHWQDDHMDVHAVALSHRVPCRAFAFTERNLERQLNRDKLMADGVAPGWEWGQLQKGRDVTRKNGAVLHAADYTRMDRTPRKLVVGGDNDTPGLLLDACRDAHVLIHEATYTQDVADRVGPWPQHSSAERVARFAHQSGLPNLVLTHFSSRYQSGPGGTPHINQLAAEALSHYNGNLFLARDFDTYRLEKDFTLTPLTADD